LASLLNDEFLTKLKQLAIDNAEKYAAAKPFPSIYFDNFLPVEAAEAALENFPEPKQLQWTEFADQNQAKLAFDEVEKLPSAVREVLYFMNSKPMLQFLETLTGIQGVIPDPYFVGGGLHQIKRGGYLEVHADFNFHTRFKLDRRLNVLLYMNKDWHEEYGGHFELWNEDMSASVTKILPLFNRCAIFSTTSTSYHGHPTPLACPKERTRKSIATYYYSNGRPEEEKTDGHSTLFQERVGAKKQLKSGTIKQMIRAVTPPIIMDAITKTKRMQ
jgi:Rps23 Pro-64 3,4-dihydroxylase Tpa1-like proline 4-hydroxylase